ncbi:MAG: hypothetical protein KDD06_15655 [Phaeodactylibacter sp.]|nr:hypothetical protein [Phaeodactylibacter sp.]
MKALYTTCIIFLGLNCWAQKWVSPNFDNHHLDYRDLGYPGVTEIPADDSRISALLTHRNNGYVYGATSGKQAYLFLYDRFINKVRPLGLIPGATGVFHTMVQGPDGQVYIGTGKNLLDEIPLTREIPGGHRQIEKQLWEDIKTYHEGYEGGHIFRYRPGKADEQVYLPEDTAALEDLGIIEPNNSVYALCFDDSKQLAYGLTYPDAIFFSMDVKTREVKKFGPLLAQKVYSGPERSWRSIPRALLCLPDGRVVTSGDGGLIVIFDPETARFEKTELRIPGEYWESWNYYGYPVVEQLIQGANRLIWGSTSDGFIFKLNLEQPALTSLGKPRLSRRTRAMALGKDEQLYIIAGELDEPCKLITYSTSGEGGFLNWGYLSVDRSPYYAKRAYQFEAITVGADGAVFIGESDRRGKLFLFLPGGKIFPGNLNPKNPR